MRKHKLYRGSPQSPLLNFSMESKAGENVSPLNTSASKKQKNMASGKALGNTIQVSLTQNKIERADSLDDNFLSEFIEKRPYSFDEDIEILNFVLKDQNIYRVSSILLWKYLEAKKRNPKRTYHSLKNRFLRNIKPKIFTTYRHLITNQDQIDKILNKFPELQKDLKSREPLAGLISRKDNKKVIENKFLNPHSNEILARSKTTKPVNIVPQRPAAAEGDSKRKVIYFNDSVYVTIHRSPDTNETSSTETLYQKYLNCKAKNKLIPCSVCGRCGGPESEMNEVQNSENENDDIISNSIENKNSQSPQSSLNSKSKIIVTEDVGGKIKDASNNKRRKNDSPTTSSYRKTSNSPSLLDDIRSLEKTEVETQSNEPATSSVDDEKRSENSTPTQTTISDGSSAKYLTPAEKLSECLTNEELESLRQGSLQSLGKILNPDEEEALVKICLKKNRRSIGIDSFLLQNKRNLDSFFAKSESPTLDSLSVDTVTSTENDLDESPLVKNMKRMLKPKTVEKS